MKQYAARVTTSMSKGAGQPAWFARLRKFAHGRSHAMSAIRRSIAKARRR